MPFGLDIGSGGTIRMVPEMWAGHATQETIKLGLTHNLGGLPQKFKHLEDQINKLLPKQARLCGEFVAKQAAKRAPFETGRLRRSLKSGVEVHGSTITTGVYSSGRASEYAEIMENSEYIPGPMSNAVGGGRQYAHRAVEENWEQIVTFFEIGHLFMEFSSGESRFFSPTGFLSEFEEAL